jgi:hypothetical protein
MYGYNPQQNINPHSYYLEKIMRDQKQDRLKNEFNQTFFDIKQMQEERERLEYLYEIAFLQFYRGPVSSQQLQGIRQSIKSNFKEIDEYFQTEIENNRLIKEKKREKMQKFEEDLEMKKKLLADPESLKKFMDNLILGKTTYSQQQQQQQQKPINLRVLYDSDFNDLVKLKDHCPWFINHMKQLAHQKIIPHLKGNINFDIPRKFAIVLNNLSEYQFKEYLDSLYEYRSKTGYPLEQAIKKYIPYHLQIKLSEKEKEKRLKMMYN